MVSTRQKTRRLSEGANVDAPSARSSVDMESSQASATSDALLPEPGHPPAATVKSSPSIARSNKQCGGNGPKKSPALGDGAVSAASSMDVDPDGGAVTSLLSTSSASKVSLSGGIRSWRSHSFSGQSSTSAIVTTDSLKATTTGGSANSRVSLDNSKLKPLKWTNSDPENFAGLTGKRRRRRTSKKELDMLESSFLGNPFPTVEEREVLAQKTYMSAREIQVWFQNRRQNERRRSVATLGEPEVLAGSAIATGQSTSEARPTLDRRHSVNSLMNNISLSDTAHHESALSRNPTAQLTPEEISKPAKKPNNDQDAAIALVGLSKSDQLPGARLQSPTDSSSQLESVGAPQFVYRSVNPEQGLFQMPYPGRVFVQVPNGAGGFTLQPLQPVQFLQPQPIFMTPRPGTVFPTGPPMSLPGQPNVPIIVHGRPPMIPLIRTDLGPGAHTSGPTLISPIGAGPPPSHLFLQPAQMIPTQQQPAPLLSPVTATNLKGVAPRVGNRRRASKTPTISTELLPTNQAGSGPTQSAASPSGNGRECSLATSQLEYSPSNSNNTHPADVANSPTITLCVSNGRDLTSNSEKKRKRVGTRVVPTLTDQSSAIPKGRLSKMFSISDLIPARPEALASSIGLAAGPAPAAGGERISQSPSEPKAAPRVALDDGECGDADADADDNGGGGDQPPTTSPMVSDDPSPMTSEDSAAVEQKTNRQTLNFSVESLMGRARVET